MLYPPGYFNFPFVEGSYTGRSVASAGGVATLPVSGSGTGR